VCGSQYSNCYVSARTSFTALQPSSPSCTLKLTPRALFLDWYHFLESRSGSPSSHSAQTFPSWGIDFSYMGLHRVVAAFMGSSLALSSLQICIHDFGNCWYRLLLPSSRWQTVQNKCIWIPQPLQRSTQSIYINTSDTNNIIGWYSIMVLPAQQRVHESKLGVLSPTLISCSCFLIWE